MAPEEKTKVRIRTDIRPMWFSHDAAGGALWSVTEGISLGEGDEPEQVRAYLRRNPGMSQVAVDGKGRVVGAVMAGHDGRRGVVCHLAVSKGSRKQGIGKRLVEAALQALAQAGISRVSCCVFRNNRTGLEFWKKAGFRNRSNLAFHSIDLGLRPPLR